MMASLSWVEPHKMLKKPSPKMHGKSVFFLVWSSHFTVMLLLSPGNECQWNIPVISNSVRVSVLPSAFTHHQCKLFWPLRTSTQDEVKTSHYIVNIHVFFIWCCLLVSKKYSLKKKNTHLVTYGNLYVYAIACSKPLALLPCLTDKTRPSWSIFSNIQRHFGRLHLSSQLITADALTQKSHFHQSLEIAASG